MSALQDFAHTLIDRARASLASLNVLDKDFRAEDVIRAFREAGAITVDSAQPFRPQSKIGEWTFLRLQARGVIREPIPGRYYLDERTLESFPNGTWLPW